MDGFEEELESASFSLDWERMELFRVPTLEEVLEQLSGSTSYKFSLMGANPIIAVDGVGACGLRRPRVLWVRGPS